MLPKKKIFQKVLNYHGLHPLLIIHSPVFKVQMLNYMLAKDMN